MSAPPAPAPAPVSPFWDYCNTRIDEMSGRDAASGHDGDWWIDRLREYSKTIWTLIDLQRWQRERYPDTYHKVSNWHDNMTGMEALAIFWAGYLEWLDTRDEEEG